MYFTGNASHIKLKRSVILKVDSMKQGQGFRKAIFVKNSAVNSKQSCQSCDCMSKGGRSPKKKVFMTLTLSNKTFLLSY